MTTLVLVITSILVYILYRQLFKKKITNNILIPFRIKKLIIFSILIIMSIASYFILSLDKKLYYHGKNIFGFYNSLPLKVKPVSRNNFEGGFALENSYGFYIISQGKYQYTNSKMVFSIKEIVKYGFTDEKLIVLVEDMEGEKYYIGCLNNENKHSKQDMIINVLNESDLIYTEEYKWIEIKNNKESIEKIKSYRNLLIFIFIILLFSLIVVGSKWQWG